MQGEQSLFFALLFFAVLFSSCKTNQIQTFIGSNNVKQFFVEPVTNKGSGFHVSIDITLRTVDGVVNAPPVVNYTVYKSGFACREEKIDLFLSSGTSEWPLQNKEMIYREFNPKCVRMSAVIDPQNFRSVVYAAEPLSIVLTDGSKKVILSAVALQKSLVKLQYVIN